MPVRFILIGRVLSENAFQTTLELNYVLELFILSLKNWFRRRGGFRVELEDNLNVRRDPEAGQKRSAEVEAGDRHPQQGESNASVASHSHAAFFATASQHPLMSSSAS